MPINSKQKGNVEVWMPCLYPWRGYYEVSSIGRVKNVAQGKGRVIGKILSTRSKNNKGYVQIQLYKGGKAKTVKLHRLVAEAFLGPMPPDLTTDHIDGDKNNNHISNLEYVTNKENNRRARLKGLMPSPYSKTKPQGKKINYEDVKNIREKIGTCSRKDLAKQYGIHIMTIGEILRGEIWKKETHEKPDR